MSLRPSTKPFKAKVKGWTATPMANHYYSLRTTQTVVAVLSTVCSLLVLYLHWRLRRRLGLVGGKRAKFMTWLVLLMTIFQTVQDVALSMFQNCLARVTDDDSFWLEEGITYNYKRCQRATWWLNESSGIMLQALGLAMSIMIALVVVYKSSLNWRCFLKWFVSISAALSIAAASFNAFGAVNCRRKTSDKGGIIRHSYDCPPPPDVPTWQVANSANFWSVQTTAYRFCTYLRIALAILSLLISLRAMFVYRRDMVAQGANSNSTRTIVFRALMDRILWYPLCQSLTRIPALYQTVFGSLQYVDQPGKISDSAFNVRLLWAYVNAILGPAGGVLMLWIFVRNNAPAKQWVAKCWGCGGGSGDELDSEELDDQRQTNGIFFPSSKWSTTSRGPSIGFGFRSSSTSLAVDNESRRPSLSASPSAPEAATGTAEAAAAAVAQREQRLRKRVSVMDEDELFLKAAAGAHYSSEQEWAEAILVSLNSSSSGGDPAPAPAPRDDDDRGGKRFLRIWLKMPRPQWMLQLSGTSEQPDDRQKTRRVSSSSARPLSRSTLRLSSRPPPTPTSSPRTARRESSSSSSSRGAFSNDDSPGYEMRALDLHEQQSPAVINPLRLSLSPGSANRGRYDVTVRL